MPRTSTQSPVPQKGKQRRVYRCIRCAERKFRMPRDLALHILQKHGRIQLPSPPSEDARSVTLNSPLLGTDVEELDQLLAAAENTISKTGKRGIREERRRGIQKRRRSQSIFSDSSQPNESSDDSGETASTKTNSDRAKTVDGESIGPKSHDVYIARCRSGRIPLVPLPPQPVTIINFANGLF